MKFAVFTVVVLALVFQTQSSVIPIGLGGIGSVLSVSGPLGPLGPLVVPGGAVSIQGSIIQGLPSSVAVQVPNLIPVQGLPSAVTVAQSPVPVALPAPVAVSSPVVIGAEGTYVAKTRGAVHVAPLAGHTKSAASVNLQPAPGTL